MDRAARLLVPDPDLGCTPLRWLETGATTSSPAAVKTELAKLAYLRRLDAHTLDLSMLPAGRRRFLAGVGRRLTGQALSRREPERRYPILLALLAESAVDVLDEVVFLFDQAISGRESAARTRLSEALAEHARQGEDRQVLLDEILAIALDPDIAEEQVGVLLRERIGMERMRAAWTARKERLPRDHGHLAMLDASMSYLRQFVPAVRFAGGPGTSDLLTAVETPGELYATGARKVPAGTPTGFVPAGPATSRPPRSAEIVTAYRHYWELCVLLAVRDGLRSERAITTINSTLSCPNQRKRWFFAAYYGQALGQRGHPRPSRARRPPDQLLAVHPLRADRHYRHHRLGRALPVAALLRVRLTRPWLSGGIGGTHPRDELP
jgi:hypothetical protein